MDDENKESENPNPAEYKSAIEYLTSQTNKLNMLSSQIGKLYSNPLLDSGLFSAATKMQNQFEKLNSFHHLLPDLTKIHKTNSALEMLRSTSIAIAGVNSKSAIQQIAESFAKQNKINFQTDIIKSAVIGKSFYNSINTPANSEIMKAILGNSVMSSLAIQSSFAKASALSVFAEKSLTSFPWQDLGQSIKLAQSTKKLITSRFVDLSTNYFNLYRSFEVKPISFTELSPTLTKSVPIEYYTGANLLEAISTNEDNDDADEELTKNEIIYENEYNLNTFLPKINSGLLKMWKGSVEAFNSNNSDKARHFMVSLRELFTHVMHDLAPDEEISGWTTNTDYFDKGRPTRKARLHYIYRNVSNGPFNKFVDRDVEATLTFIGIFQQGTHGIDNPFTEKQLAAIKSKAESTLKFLLEIHFSTNVQ